MNPLKPLGAKKMLASPRWNSKKKKKTGSVITLVSLSQISAYTLANKNKKLQYRNAKV